MRHDLNIATFFFRTLLVQYQHLAKTRSGERLEIDRYKGWDHSSFVLFVLYITVQTAFE